MPDSEITAYCEEIPNTYPHLDLIADEIVWKMKIKQGKYADALDRIGEYLTDSRDGRNVLGALIDRFYTHHYYLGDLPGAASVLAELQSRYPEDINTKVAEMVFGNQGSDPGYEQEALNTTCDEIREKYALLQNYPNPGNPATTIRFSIPEPGHVVVRIINILGQEVRRLLDRHRPSGHYSVIWDGRNSRGEEVPTGLYLYTLEAGGQVFIKKLILLR
jgi:hypothetical protein